MLSIPEFYDGQSILITGGTGFMGKVLIEKILRSCPRVSQVFLLMRSKREVPIRERLKKLTESKLFDRIKQISPECLEKLKAIHSDMMKPNLGLSEEDLKLLKSEVSIIFHSAATVKFNEPLRTSILMNVGGTHQLLKIAQEMPKLLAFIHISTAYSNCDLDVVEEKIYPMDVQPQKLMDALEWMDDEMIEKITPKLLGGKPNTYTFTKAMAEVILQELRGNVPVAIIRPSIVTCAWKEPLPGWIDNLNTITGIIAGFGSGILRTGCADKNLRVDCIPVDMCINLIISVAWYTALYKPKDIIVYNSATGMINPVKWSKADEMMWLYKKYPFEFLYRIPSGSFKSSPIVNKIVVYLDHYLPAILFDIVCKITRIKLFPRGLTAMGIYRRLDKVISSLDFFRHKEWDFISTNQNIIDKTMTVSDVEEFNFDVKEIDWLAYFEIYILGIKQYVLNEDLKNLPRARRNYKIRYALGCAFYLASIMCLWKLVSSTTTCFDSLNEVFFGYFMKLYQVFSYQKIITE